MAVDPTLREALQDLKAAIRDPARAAVEAFERTTGLSPTRIDIVLTDVTNSSYSRRRTVVSDVRIGLDDF